jgi:hypothetical protein
MLDDFEIDYPEDETYLDDEEGGSGPDRKVLLIIGAIVGGIVIVGLCIGAYFMVIVPRQEAAQLHETETAVAAAATEAQGLTQTAIAGIPAATFTPLPTELPTNTPTATATEEPQSALPSVTSEGGPTADPRTATVQALLTQAALAQTQAAAAILTVTATPTSTALPDTGFADDVGIPALLAMTALLIMVIFVARRLREATA